jgi:hypothetical protein
MLLTADSLHTKWIPAVLVAAALAMTAHADVPATNAPPAGSPVPGAIAGSTTLPRGALKTTVVHKKAQQAHTPGVAPAKPPATNSSAQ